MVEVLRAHESISTSLIFRTSFGTSSMNNWYKLTQTLNLTMFRCQIVLSLPTQPRSASFPPPLPFTMPQVTSPAQGGCFVNVSVQSILGGVALPGTTVFSFNMTPTNQVSVGCMSRGYAIFFLFVITSPTFRVRWSPGIGLSVPHPAQTQECGRSSLILIIRVIWLCRSSISTSV